MRNPGSINQSVLIHLSRILERTVCYPYMIGMETETVTQSKIHSKRKVVHKSFCSVSLHGSDSGLSDSPLRSLADLHQQAKRSPECPYVDCAGSIRSPCAHGSANKHCTGKTTILVGRKVVLYSLSFDHLSFGYSAPSTDISEVALIGSPLEGFYVAVGGS